MKRIVRSPYGDWMPAIIQIKGNKVRVSPKGKSPIILSRKNVPDNLVPGKWFIQLNVSKKTINNWKPMKGMYKAKLQKFSSKEDEPPRPKTYDRESRDGYPYQVQEFTVIFEISSDDANGTTITYNVPFKFDYDEEEVDGKVRRTLQIAGRGKRTDALEEFLRVTGVWDKKLPYKDNPLPMLEKVILNEAREFNIQIEKGWISSIYESNVPEEDTDFTGDDDTPWKE